MRLFRKAAAADVRELAEHADTTGLLRLVREGAPRERAAAAVALGGLLADPRPELGSEPVVRMLGRGREAEALALEAILRTAPSEWSLIKSLAVQGLYRIRGGGAVAEVLASVRNSSAAGTEGHWGLSNELLALALDEPGQAAIVRRVLNDGEFYGEAEVEEAYAYLVRYPTLATRADGGQEIYSPASARLAARLRRI